MSASTTAKEKAAAEKAAAKAAETSQGSDPAAKPTDAEVEAASTPGGQPGAVIGRPDLVDNVSSAKASAVSGHPDADIEAVKSAAGPLTVPEDGYGQTFPANGFELSSTDATYAASGGRTVAGEQFDALVGEDGESVSADALFEDDGSKTYVVAKQRVFEQFYYPNTVEKAKRLLYTPGQRVNRADAERVKATLNG